MYSAASPSRHIWNQLTYTFNGTTESLYLNGTLDNRTVQPIALNSSLIFLGTEATLNRNYAGLIDEMGIWNRSLTNSEVIQLYNSASGLTYTPLSNATNTRVYIGDEVTNLNVSSNGTVPVSIYLGNFKDTLRDYYNTCTFISGFCNIPFIFESFTSGNITYSNLLFDNLGFIENSKAFNSTTTETSTENFTINITYDSVFYPISSAVLYYNNTAYTSSKIGSGDNIMFMNTLQVPTLTASTNKTFYWTVGLTNTSGSLSYYNSTFSNQTVNPINITSCTSGNIAFNFTTYNEQTLNRINPFTFQATFNVWAGDGSVYRTFNFNNLSTIEQLICITPSIASYRTDAYIQYDDGNSSLYTARNYYLVNNLVSNTTQSIFLYLLNNSVSTSFVLNLLDQNNLPVSGAYIYSERYYPGENVFRTVQIAKTDTSGNSVGFFQTEVPDYRFTIVKNGVTELITTPQKVVPTAVPYTLYFKLGTAIIPSWTYFQNASGFLYTGPLYNNETDMVTLYYQDTTGNLTYVRMVVSTTNYTGTNGVICDTNSSLASSILTCNVSSVSSGNIQAAVYLSRSPETPIALVTFTINSLLNSFGRLGYLLGWLIIISCAMVGLYNPTAGIIMTNIGIWVVWLMGFITFGPIWALAILALSVFLISELNT